MRYDNGPCQTAFEQASETERYSSGSKRRNFDKAKVFRWMASHLFSSEVLELEQ